MSGSTDRGVLVLGTVTRPRGLRGEVIVRGEADLLSLLEKGVTLDLADEQSVREVTLEMVRETRGGVVIRISGVTDRNGAEALKGARFQVDPAELPPPTLEQWLWVQVQGFEVVTSTGERLGVAEERIVTGAHDVFVVRGDVEEILIPASPNVLRGIDAGARRMTVEPVPGLLELNRPGDERA